jgi:hypothetical protein
LPVSLGMSLFATSASEMRIEVSRLAWVGHSPKSRPRGEGGYSMLRSACWK